jgi:hypothetical protein
MFWSTLMWFRSFCIIFYQKWKNSATWC